MEARARHLEDVGHTAFFIRVDEIEDGFENALEVDNTFTEWVNSGEEAWMSPCRPLTSRLQRRATHWIVIQIKYYACHCHQKFR